MKDETMYDVLLNDGLTDIMDQKKGQIVSI